MTALLTKDDYHRIAAELTIPAFSFVDGKKVRARSEQTFRTSNPATGETVAELPACSAKDVDLAVQAARAAFDSGCWSKRAPSERKAVILRLADLIEKNLVDLAVMESLDSGKTIFDCITVDLPETIKTLRWHAEAIDKIYDQVAPSSADHVALVVREAVGVVGLIVPWNFPLLMLAWKIGPALAAGCTLVVKPAEETSLTSLRVAELAQEAGLPDGVLNVVTGTGPDVGEPLARHPGVDAVSFTGSTDTGRRILQYSAESNLKEIVLEMGGKNPCIVMNDAENLDAVAQHVVNGTYWNMGENCSAISRLIVHRDVKEALLEKMVVALADWPVGDPLDPQSRIGPMVSERQFKKVASYLSGNETVVHGAKTLNGRYVYPTIVAVPGNEDRLAQDEIFGPILAVITVDSLEDALSIANNTRYGLAASIFTANGRNALRAAREIRAGTVTVNCFGEGDITTPFGGFKQSGFGGRDNGIHAHDQYTQIKTIWVNLASA